MNYKTRFMSVRFCDLGLTILSVVNDRGLSELGGDWCRFIPREGN